MLHRLIKYFLIFFALQALLGCRSGYLDNHAKLTRSDIVDSFIESDRGKGNNRSKISQVPIPQISNMLSFPKPPEFTQGNQIISFSVTDDIDLKDVLIELGRVTGLDVDIDSKISGGVIINAKNRPLIEIIDRIASLGNIRYSFVNGVLVFKNDSAFAKHHLVDYLIDGALWGEVTDNLSTILSSVSSEASSISPNKSAGIITIFSNNAGQEAAISYLATVKESASAQVLIEAKVVEVTLTEEYSAGIDWGFLDGGTTVSSKPVPATDTSPFNISAAGTGVLGGAVTIDIAALEKFGTVRAVSSPRVSALNNRQAKLDFLNKLVYFTLETESNTTNSTVSTTTNTVNATMNEEPIGVELTITPSIDVRGGNITLDVNPKLSVSTETASDPSVDADGNSLGNEVPIVQTREIETTMKIKSGDTLVIGGLMKEDAASSEEGIPFLSKIPILGHLFKYTSKKTDIVETVIFIKATIVDSIDGVTPYDREINNKFTTSKRPYL